MSDISPRRFTDTEYFCSYYHRSHVSDEINFIAPMNNDIRLALSYERSKRNPKFTSEEIRVLSLISWQVGSLLLRHWRACAECHAPLDKSGYEKFRARLPTFGKGTLTPREQEVVGLLLQGFSNSAIGDLLDISVHTAKVHRRNIYTKLGISNLSELYRMAIDATT